MNSYYSTKLSASKLKQCYDLAPPRIKEYLQAEVEFVKQYISTSDTVLELGCGYGRVIADIAPLASKVVGIDISQESLKLAREFLSNYPNIELHEMNANNLNFDFQFDIVIAIQNSISTFNIEKLVLLREAIKATRTGGKVMLSSYSEKIWEHRLEWFKLQVDEGLVGEIDFDETKNGIIVCKDGFKASTINSDEFQSLCSNLHVSSEIIEVNNSSIFCVITI
jgi:2-polyprenyl-6-hydroxyphenyl methylase/3-demethylubiquinone-9 3-methyltransferase